METTNIRELLINLVSFDKPNMLTGSNQKVCGEEWSLKHWAIVDNRPPAKRKSPTCSETNAKQRKPKRLPATAGEPQGKLMALWAEECGKSERLPVMGGIRAGSMPDAKAG